MEIFSEKLAGPFELTKDMQLNGMVSGDLTVLSGVNLILNGMVTGNLVLRDGANLELNGMVNGQTIVQGSTLKVRGHTSSVSIQNNDADVWISPDAFVGK